jgi:hypothetical protein
MSESRTTGGERSDETQARHSSISQYQLRDRPWPNRALGLASDETLIPGEPGTGESVQLPPTEYAYAPRQPPQQQLPVQAVVNRLSPLEPMLVDIEILSDGKVIQILRYPEFGPYGPDPNDPGWFSTPVNPRAVCAVLAPYAAARCLAGVGYW